MADRSGAIVGSLNLTTGSLDKRREVAAEDWKNSFPIDVSDEGVLAGLARHGRRDAAERWRSRHQEPG